MITISIMSRRALPAILRLSGLIPIAVAAVLVFIASSIMHMAIPLHRNDYSKLHNEDDVLEAMRGCDVTPGNYMFPHCAGAKDMKSEAQTEKWNKGPVGIMTVMPSGPPAMGKLLLQWFVYTLAVGFLVAYVCRLTLAAGSEYLLVMRVASAAAFLAYAVGAPVESIWKHQKWSTSFKYVIDGLVYALITGGTFGWLWPAA